MKARKVSFMPINRALLIHVNTNGREALTPAQKRAILQAVNEIVRKGSR